MDELTTLASRYGTDKVEHGFSAFYHQHLRGARTRARRVLEIGVLDGASVRMWRDYFPRAHVHGLDVTPPPLDDDDRIRLHRGDQADRASLAGVLEATGSPLDLVVDDGGHTMSQQQVSLGFLFAHLRPGGHYVVEDLHTSFWERIATTRPAEGVSEADGSYPTGTADTRWTTYELLERLSAGEPIDSDYMTAEERAHLSAQVDGVWIFDRDGDRQHMTAVLRKRAGSAMDGVRRGFGRLLTRLENRVDRLSSTDTAAAAPASASTAADGFIARAVACLEQGDLETAERVASEGLDDHPDSVSLHHLRGSLLGQRGEAGAAREDLARAASLAPDDVDVLVDLGHAERLVGDGASAEHAYRRAIDLDPGHAGANLGCGQLLASVGRLDPARMLLEQAVASAPDNAGARYALAEVLLQQGELASAEEHYAALAHAAPGEAALQARLGLVEHRLGRLDEAVASYERALAIAPDAYELHNDLGLVLMNRADLEGAEQAFRRAGELAPEFAGARINLGNSLKDQRRLGEAVDAYEQALTLAPDDADAHNNLANALQDTGRVADSLPHYREALAARPRFVQAHSNMLFAMQYLSDITPADLLAEHRAFDERHTAPLASQPPPAQSPAGRKLRIGYVSADLRSHPIGLFLEPVLAHHDPDAVQVTCYADDMRADAVTERLRALPGTWRSIAGMSDERLAEAVREDGIDVLVDLAGHSAGHRLLAFARRPAPVQATWIGYLHSTGMRAMDYYLGDAVVAPPGSEGAFTERVARLPESFLCYGQPAGTPPVAPAPASAAGHPTFGAICNVAKFAQPVVALWARILERVPGARLRLKNGAFADAATVDRYRDAFVTLGVDPERLEFSGHSDRDAYLAEFAEIDVLLDTFPFSGGTVSCDALWMGVPVVTMPGEQVASRTSASVLHALGLDECVARDADHYVEVAASLAADPARLDQLRSGMRARFAASTLGDAGRFTRALEALYREMVEQAA